MTLIKGKHLGGFSLLPAKPGTCEWCAVAHEKEMPHNAQSMFYQYRFYNKHGRFPNWNDALSHCSDEMKKAWRDNLIEKGVDVDNGGVNPECA